MLPVENNLSLVTELESSNQSAIIFLIVFEVWNNKHFLNSLGWSRNNQAQARFEIFFRDHSNEFGKYLLSVEKIL